MTMGTPIRRRNRDSSWQWLFIGMALGVGCSMVVCLASYVVGIIEIGGLSDSPSETGGEVAVVSPIVLTATDAPTIAPLVATTQPTESINIDQSQQPANTQGAELTTVTPTILPGSGNVNAGQGGGETIGGTPVEFGAVGTPAPIGSPTITPSIGSAPAAPQELLTAASELRDIPGGTFTMGTTMEEALLAVDQCKVRDQKGCNEAMVQDSIPAHQVTVDDFKMEVFEVSVTQYLSFLNSLAAQSPVGIRVDKVGCTGGPCILTIEDDPQSYVQYNAEANQYEITNPSFYANHPITYVTWAGAVAYCESIGRRLPTEAEWERAARGPANSIYPWGQQWVPTNAKTSVPNPEGTVPVDSFPGAVNAYGLFNIAGNVSEWVKDFYSANYYTQPEAAGPNPQGPQFSDKRVARGGGWDNPPLFSRTVHRIDVEPNSPRGSVGFRCAGNG